MNYRTDPILGEAFCIFIFFRFPDSEIFVLTGLQIYSLWRDSENTEYLEMWLCEKTRYLGF